jgi:hypothetical protein
MVKDGEKKKNKGGGGRERKWGREGLRQKGKME